MDEAKLAAQFEAECGWLAFQLGNIHTEIEICLSILEKSKLSKLQRGVLAKLRKELTKSQEEFLARFSDWGKPGAN